MDRVVDTEPDGQHNVDAGDDIDSDAPEVEESDDVGEGEENRDEDQETDAEVTEEDDSDQKHLDETE